MCSLREIKWNQMEIYNKNDELVREERERDREREREHIKKKGCLNSHIIIW